MKNKSFNKIYLEGKAKKKSKRERDISFSNLFVVSSFCFVCFFKLDRFRVEDEEKKKTKCKERIHL